MPVRHAISKTRRLSYQDEEWCGRTHYMVCRASKHVRLRVLLQSLLALNQSHMIDIPRRSADAVVAEKKLRSAGKPSGASPKLSFGIRIRFYGQVTPRIFIGSGLPGQNLAVEPRLEMEKSRRDPPSRGLLPWPVAGWALLDSGPLRMRATGDPNGPARESRTSIPASPQNHNNCSWLRD